MFAIILTIVAAVLATVAAWIMDVRSYRKSERFARIAGWAGIFSLIALFVIACILLGVSAEDFPVRGINL